MYRLEKSYFLSAEIQLQCLQYKFYKYKNYKKTFALITQLHISIIIVIIDKTNIEIKKCTFLYTKDSFFL